jgi:hypothetical protein
VLSSSTPASGRAARYALVALAAAAIAWLADTAFVATTAGRAAGAPTRMTDAQGRKPNHLAREKSPYLLQHAYNPVDWYPWGEEAFAKARREGKPIFLSIGYSTCHWCHVMERESFENDSVAALLNEYFVAIKVDREERPDVDRIYMTAMQAMGFGGGWPLNVFLTPDLEPFFGGTYFPADSRMGRPGMLQMLPRVHEAWTQGRESLEATGGRVIAALASFSTPEVGSADRARVFDSAYAPLDATFDAVHGGFGNAPKFPSVSNLNYLLRWWARDPAARDSALRMVTAQLDGMRAGGIHDQLGGGFHRYSTDREWLVPHFEKMLYDQAQLAWIYLDAYQITRDERYAATARDVFAYVARDLSSPGGGFDSAEDADSEGEEGKFYVWAPADLERVLGREDAALFAHRYGVTAAGNFEHGTTILSEVASLEETAQAFSIPPADAARRLEATRAKLLAERSRRVRPHLDDKVLASWNGLMISAFARGARVLGDPALGARGVRAASFVWEQLWDPKERVLARRWRDGEAAGAGQLDDYAYLALGFTDLYEATFDPAWLERAATLTAAQVDRFWDAEHGGFFESPAGDSSVKVRMKDGFDGAEMAGNSIAAANLERLGLLLDREEWRTMARRTMDYYAARLSGGAVAMPQMLVAFDLADVPPRHVVIAGDPAHADTRALIAEYDRRFLPHDMLLLAAPGAARANLTKLVPWTAALAAPGGHAAAFVCENYACKLPVKEPAAFAALLDQHRAIPEDTKTR